MSTYAFQRRSLPTVKFTSPGDTVTGDITEIEDRQQTEFSTDEPLFWDDAKTRPRMMTVITLDTVDGKRRLFIKGKYLEAAMNDAVDAAGTDGPAVGGTLTVTYTGDGEPAKGSMFPPKLYAATYTPPVKPGETARVHNTSPEVWNDGTPLPDEPPADDEAPGF